MLAPTFQDVNRLRLRAYTRALPLRGSSSPERKQARQSDRLAL